MKLKTQNSKLKTTTGQAMLLTVLILGGSILSASTIAGYLMLLKIRTASDIANSTKAIFAADTGIEWELYKLFKNPNDTGIEWDEWGLYEWGLYELFKNPNYPKPSLSNGANFTSSNDGTVIKSIGQSLNSFRAFEMRLSGAPSTLPASP